MAEEIQPTKKHKNNMISTLTDIQECELIGVHLPTPLVNPQPEEAEPIGAQLSTQSAIPIGEEAKLDATHSSESFLDSDARKTIDDNLNLVTRDLPKFSSLHNVTSVAIMGTVDAIQIPLIRARAYQHIRKALTEAFPLLEASAIKLATDIAQTKLAVSTAKSAIDEHNSKARSAAASAAAGGSASEDADLTEGLSTSEDVLATLKATHKTADTKLTALITRHTTILSELSLWKGTLKEVKRRLDKGKREYNKNKRANPGASAGATEVDLSDVNEWVLSSSSRALTERVRDPLHALNPHDRLSATWAEQPFGHEHVFKNVIDRSTLTPPKGGENRDVLCTTTATIIFYNLPADTDSCLRYINALDFPRPATRLRVIKPKGNRAGASQIPVVITALTAYIWRLLEQRVVYFTNTLAVGIRHAVNDENTVEPRHAWVERVPNAPQWLPRNYPFGIQDAIRKHLNVKAILMPKKLDLTWYEGICLTTSGLDIVFQTTADLITFMGHTHPEIPLYIAQGGVSNTTARIMGEVFTMDEVLGAYAVDFLNLPRNITAERLLSTLQDLGLQPQGFKDVTKGRGFNGSILRVGFPSKPLRHQAVLQLSGQIYPQLHRGALRVSLARDIPRGHCFKCGRKGHSARDTNKCTPTCYICHKPLVEVVDGVEHEHDCVYVQEDYDPRAFKQSFMQRTADSSSSCVTPTRERPRPSYITRQGRLPSPSLQATPTTPGESGGRTQPPQTQHHTPETHYQQASPAPPQYQQQPGPQPPVYYTADGQRVYLQPPQPQVFYTAEGQPVYVQQPHPQPQYAPPPQVFMTPQPQERYGNPYHLPPGYPAYDQQQYQQPAPQRQYQPEPPRDQWGQPAQQRGQEYDGDEQMSNRGQGGPSPVPGPRRTLNPGSRGQK